MFSKRGLVLNVAKTKFRFDTLIKLLELVSNYKYNIIILQISDTNRFAFDTQYIKQTEKESFTLEEQEKISKFCAEKKLQLGIKVNFPDKLDRFIELLNRSLNKKDKNIDSFKSTRLIDFTDIDIVLENIKDICKRLKSKILHIGGFKDCFSCDQRRPKEYFERLVSKISLFSVVNNMSVVVDLNNDLSCSWFDKNSLKDLPKYVIQIRDFNIRDYSANRFDIHKYTVFDTIELNSYNPIFSIYSKLKEKLDYGIKGIFIDIDTYFINDENIFKSITPYLQILGEKLICFETDVDVVLGKIDRSFFGNGFKTLTSGLDSNSPRFKGNAIPNKSLTEEYHNYSGITSQCVDILLSKEIKTMEKYSVEYIGCSIKSTLIKYIESFNEKNKKSHITYRLRIYEIIKNCLEEKIAYTDTYNNGFIDVLRIFVTSLNLDN